VIHLPWQIIVAFIGLFAFNLLLQYLRRVNCDERVEAAKRMQHRDTMAVYRQTYQTAWEHGQKDGQDNA
jgi:hypothetical protein